jgi:hypothetical protein
LLSRNVRTTLKKCSGWFGLEGFDLCTERRSLDAGTGGGASHAAFFRYSQEASSDVAVAQGPQAMDLQKVRALARKRSTCA